VLLPVALFGGVALVLAACGSSSGASSTTTTSTTAGPADATGSSTTPATVLAVTTSLGKILENSSGMALYTYGPNHGGTTNMCTGACLQAWPALTVPASASPMGGPGVTGTLGTAKQADGTTQVTYDGNLLYTFLSDDAGKVTGNGVAGFSVAKVTAASTPGAAGGGAAPTTTTTARSGYGGY
jgi:predicted lipoprotein with Yx(FWY)xxD motif